MRARPTGHGLALRLAMLALLLPGLLVAWLASVEGVGAQSAGTTINVFCLGMVQTGFTVQPASPLVDGCKLSCLTERRLNHALDFGKTFPEGQTIKAQGLASDKIRAVLAYALSKGYVTSNPYQVQLAVWNL